MDSRVVYRRRAPIRALPLLYSGPLMKWSNTEMDFLSYYGELRGATLFLYREESQNTYTEKLDLGWLTSVDLCCLDKRKTGTIMTLSLQGGDVLLKLDNPDTEEEWRGYILTMIHKEIPSDLQLLPGQMLQLTDALRSMRGRDPPTLPPLPLPPQPSFPLSSPPSPSPPPEEDTPEFLALDTPECFFHVTRQQAEKMLEENPECGDIILRPSSQRNNFALTLRLPTASGAVMKNYRVSCTDSGFVIELHSSVTLSSLDEVVNYFVQRTQKFHLHPYVASQIYDTRIDTSPVCERVPQTRVGIPAVQLQTQDRSDYFSLYPEEGEYPQDSEI